MAGKRFSRGPLGPLAIACAAVLLILGTAAPALADDPPAPRAVTTPRAGRAALSGTSYDELVTYAHDSAGDLQHQARDDLRSVARQFAVQAGVDPNIFEAQINQESGFNPSAYNPSGATGIAQIVPLWHPNVDPTDPIASLQYAANLMASHLANYGGDYRLALAAYNAGPGAVRQYGGVPPYAETQNYVAKVLGAAGGSPNFGPEEPEAVPDGAMVVLIAHAGGLVSLYAHLDDQIAPPSVATGEQVHEGQTIGAVGMTGLTTGPHLHFVVWRDGELIDPLSLVAP